MKMWIQFMLLSLLGDVPCISGRKESNNNGFISSNHHRYLTTGCILLIRHSKYDDDTYERDEPLECELQKEDLIEESYKSLVVRGLTTSWAITNHIVSGMTTLISKDAIIDLESNELVLPKDQSWKLGKVSSSTVSQSLYLPRQRDLGISLKTTENTTNTITTKRVLVLRAMALDRTTTASESELAEDIFGSTNDLLNLQSQYRECSNGKMHFVPATNHSLVGKDGVYTVKLDSMIVTGEWESNIRNAMIEQATLDLGPLTNIAHHIMVCIPPGTVGGWIAYANVNHWMSVYNDNWCRYPSAQVHEIGHNLNLGHSKEGNNTYGDQSCMMGYSYSKDEIPFMCFNGPKTWQLGWYDAYHVDLPMNGNFHWRGSLIGFAETSSALPTDRMIIRIRSKILDYYIHFNRKIGMNDGTQEGPNQVLVTTRPPGTGYATSDLVAKMASLGIYTIPYWNGSVYPLMIRVESIVFTSIPARAYISIDFNTTRSTTSSIQNTVLSPSPMSVSSYRTPTRSPTRSPTKRIPTRSPTTFPIKLPSISRSMVPTFVAPMKSKQGML